MKVTNNSIKHIFVIVMSALILSLNDFSFWVKGFIVGTCAVTIVWYRYRINLLKFNKKPSYFIFVTLHLFTKSFLSVYILLLPIIVFQLIVNQEYNYSQTLVGNFELLMVKLSILMKRMDLSKFGIVSIILLIFSGLLTFFLSSRKVFIFMKITELLNSIIFLLFFISSFSFLGKELFENFEKQWIIKSSNEIRNLISQLEDKHHKILVYHYFQKEISKKEDFWKIIASSLAFSKVTEIYLNQYDLHVTRKELLKIDEYIRILKLNNNSEKIKSLDNFFEELQFRELQRKIYIEKISNKINDKVSIYKPSLEIIIGELDKNPLEILTKYQFNNLFSGQYNPDEIVKKINALKIDLDSKTVIEKQRRELLRNTLANTFSQVLPSINSLEIESFVEKIIDLCSRIKINFFDKTGKKIKYDFIIKDINIKSDYKVKINNFNESYQLSSYDIRKIEFEIKDMQSSILAQAKIDAALTSKKFLSNEIWDKSIWQKGLIIPKESFWERLKKGKIRI